ncbi:MAG: PEP/pyruvate-binding domain-containing protein, partial [Candidatus Kapaibacterium sp.]
MTDKNKSMDMVIKSLEERAKELNCLYKIEELLTDPSLDEKEVIQGIAHAIPPGWQYSDICVAKVVVNTISKQTPGFKDTPWRLTAPIIVQDEPVGRVEVHYLEKMPNAGEGPFLKEERKLINTIADRLGHYILHHRLKKVFQDWQSQKAELDGSTRHRPEWSIVIEMLRKTDHNLFSVISRRMINHLFCRGVDESKKLFEKLGSNLDFGTSTSTEVNRPSKKQVLESSYNLGMEIFTIASKYFTEDELLNQIQKWVHEERSHFLVKALANLNTPLSEVADAIRRYHHINPDNDQHVSPIGKGIRVSLIRRFLTDQLQFIDIAKSYSRLQDFYDLLQNMIFPPESHGKLGGKSAGLFLARKIIKVKNQYEDILKDVKIPKTWYITSDGLMSFMYYNNLEDIIEQKYKDIEDIRKEYPHIIQAFKNSNFPAEIVNGLSRALDDFGDNPIIVRSSSLLEDRMGSAFAGKYKSLFLGNQGSKKHKLETLMDAIAEVYASTFGPDPIGYRFEKGLLDFNEEMGIMIQEV